MSMMIPKVHCKLKQFVQFTLFLAFPLFSVLSHIYLLLFLTCLIQEFEQKENPDIFDYDDYYCRERERVKEQQRKIMKGGEEDKEVQSSETRRERKDGTYGYGPSSPSSLKAATQMSGTADFQRVSLLLAQVEMVYYLLKTVELARSVWICVRIKGKGWCSTT